MDGSAARDDEPGRRRRGARRLPASRSARLIPNPWSSSRRPARCSAATSGDVFQSTRAQRPELRRRTCAATTTSPKATNIDLGASYACGHNAPASWTPSTVDSTTRLFGVDATFRWRPLRRSIYRSFIGRTELDLEPAASSRTGRQTANGFYVSRRLPVRAAVVRRRALRPIGARASTRRSTDTGGSLTLTFWPSEFSQVRGQYRRTNYARRADGERVPVPVPVLDRRARRAPVLGRQGFVGFRSVRGRERCEVIVESFRIALCRTRRALAWLQPRGRRAS